MTVARHGAPVIGGHAPLSRLRHYHSVGCPHGATGMGASGDGKMWSWHATLVCRWLAAKVVTWVGGDMGVWRRMVVVGCGATKPWGEVRGLVAECGHGAPRCYVRVSEDLWQALSVGIWVSGEMCAWRRMVVVGCGATKPWGEVRGLVAECGHGVPRWCVRASEDLWQALSVGMWVSGEMCAWRRMVVVGCGATKPWGEVRGLVAECGHGAPRWCVRVSEDLWQALSVGIWVSGEMCAWRRMVVVGCGATKPWGEVHGLVTECGHGAPRWCVRVSEDLWQALSVGIWVSGETGARRRIATRRHSSPLLGSRGGEGVWVKLDCQHVWCVGSSRRLARRRCRPRGAWGAITPHIKQIQTPPAYAELRYGAPADLRPSPYTRSLLGVSPLCCAGSAET
ncbi:hypothetical protein MAIT1_04941 [Magnetofaba australis IT-1]|uniref:Uncharacterized protein n=1 Tax=Magnetofaba australis IT-1 TaxID=1434232 RepID=A0A1Y2KA75_9PROT|nr:hypothetical protein MAIT1_04941 [Magnetofaba australis IT-1]